MKKSLQAIEDYYIQKGLAGDTLREAITNDKEYQELIKEKREQISGHYDLTEEDKQKYVLSTDQDFEILGRAKLLEAKNLFRDDRLLVELIKSQLEDEWRKPLYEALEKLERKYEEK